jgi:hypothetical protein
VCDQEQIDKRQQQMSEFCKWREDLEKQFRGEREERLALRKGETIIGSRMLLLTVVDQYNSFDLNRVSVNLQFACQ